MAPPDTSSSALQAHAQASLDTWISGRRWGAVRHFPHLLFHLGLAFRHPGGSGRNQTDPAPGSGSSGDPPGARPRDPAASRRRGWPPATLEAELSGVLAKLEEANQKKDLQQLLSLYSPSFPDLPQKAQEISRSWASYDYLSLNFKLTEIKSPTPDSASARVTWKIKTRQRQTQKIKDTH